MRYLNIIDGSYHRDAFDADVYVLCDEVLLFVVGGKDGRGCDSR